MELKFTFEDGSEAIAHYGVKGQKWGIWNEETAARRNGSSPDTLFVSGSSKTQFKESPYYRKNLPRGVRKELKSSMKMGDKIIVGDAPGVDRQVQDFLAKKKYSNVEIYSPGTESRYKAGKDWVNHLINDTEHEPGSKEWLAKKDKAMTKAATKGLAVILDEGSNATRNNISRMESQGKSSKVYMLDKRGKRHDKWVDRKNAPTKSSNYLENSKWNSNSHSKTAPRP